MNRLFTIAVLTAAMAVSAMAIQVAPEIDPASGSAALSVLAGAALMIRARARR